MIPTFNTVFHCAIGCVDGYLKCMEYNRIPSTILAYQASDDPLYSGYRAAFEASAREETLVWSCSMFNTCTWIIFLSILCQCSRMCLQLGFASWEPPHGPYKMKSYPWKSFTKVSGSLRHCSFAVIALHGCILSEIQVAHIVPFTLVEVPHSFLNEYAF